MREWQKLPWINIAKLIEPHHGGAFEPDSLADVRSLEDAVEVKLPETWVAILTKYGASGFVGSASVESFSGPVFVILTLFGVAEIRDDHAAHESYGGTGLVPIGDDEFNNRYVWGSADRSVAFIDYTNQEETLNIAP